MDKKLTTPILFLIFNRPDTTQQVFNEIKKAKPTKLFVAADGPRDNNRGDSEKCQRAREIINQVNWDCEVKTLFRDKNLGCKIAVSSAINWFFENTEEGVVLEDDCFLGQNLLKNFSLNISLELMFCVSCLREKGKSTNCQFIKLKLLLESPYGKK